MSGPCLNAERFGQTRVALAGTRDGFGCADFPGVLGASNVWLAKDSHRIWAGSYKGKDWKHLVRPLILSPQTADLASSLLILSCARDCAEKVLELKI